MLQILQISTNFQTGNFQLVCIRLLFLIFSLFVSIHKRSILAKIWGAPAPIPSLSLVSTGLINKLQTKHVMSYDSKIFHTCSQFAVDENSVGKVLFYLIFDL